MAINDIIDKLFAKTRKRPQKQHFFQTFSRKNVNLSLTYIILFLTKCEIRQKWFFPHFASAIKSNFGEILNFFGGIFAERIFSLPIYNI